MLLNIFFKRNILIYCNVYAILYATQKLTNTIGVERIGPVNVDINRLTAKYTDSKFELLPNDIVSENANKSVHITIHWFSIKYVKRRPQNIPNKRTSQP